MNKIFTFFVVLLCSASLVGCQNMSNQDVGVVSGGVAGGLLGSMVGGGSGKLAAVAIGAIAGAYLGGAIGKNMDENDRMRMNAALDSNDVGKPAYWRNARTHTRYEVVPVKNVRVGRNEYCREYRTVAFIDGRKQQMYGTACRQPDGSWQAVK